MKVETIMVYYHIIYKNKNTGTREDPSKGSHIWIFVSKSQYLKRIKVRMSSDGLMRVDWKNRNKINRVC